MQLNRRSTRCKEKLLKFPAKESIVKNTNILNNLVRKYQNVTNCKSAYLRASISFSVKRILVTAGASSSEKVARRSIHLCNLPVSTVSTDPPKPGFPCSKVKVASGYAELSRSMAREGPSKRVSMR
jgi:hypothetical protein